MSKAYAIFRPLIDQRSLRNRRHKFIEIIILSILAVLSGADSYDEIEQFGNEKIRFLKKFLDLRNGIPSHDTINRVFQSINPAEFERCFAIFTQCLIEATGQSKQQEETLPGQHRDHIALDGKTSRGTKDRFKNKSPLHSVHAWSVANSLCLGQVACESKTNEITTLPLLIDMLDVRGCIITIDAQGTQTAIVDQIIEKGGDYILAVKGNQPTLHENVQKICNNDKALFDSTITEKNHGRIETRRAEIFNNDPNHGKRWKSLKTVVKITATREFPNGDTTSQERYYISSLEPDCDFNQYIRSHWEIENKLHWVLDMTFREDAERKRAKHAAANFAIVRKIALNILKKDKGKGSLKGKRLKAAWNDDFLVNLLCTNARLF
jgi:predicted transposase YbfD/YdcC